MLPPETRKTLLSQVHKGESELSFYEPISPLHHLEARYTLFCLRQILLSRDSLMSEHLLSHFTVRWKAIRTFEIQYPDDSYNPANVACVAIAKNLSKVLSRSYLELLMPPMLVGSLTKDTDIYPANPDETALYIGLLDMIKKNKGFNLNPMDIVYIADQYVSAKRQGNAAITIASRDMLFHIHKQGYTRPVIMRAEEKMSPEIRQEFIDLALFKQPSAVPGWGGRFYVKPPVERRTATEAGFEIDERPVNRKLF